MQIKFNKIVRPVAVKPEDSRPARQETVNQETEIPAQNPEQEIKSSPAEQIESIESFLAEFTKQTDTMPEVEIPKTETEDFKPAVQPEDTVIPETVSSNPPVNAVTVSSGVPAIEETLKKFIGKSIRVYTADHENVIGRLESIKDGWIKICNARSAGGGYYCDEDIINIRNIVRFRFIRNITKSDYVEFTNAEN
ncbi:MAG: hypothetical protein K2N49_04250 [Ruminococcus sp.]|nr:hypothetical protein [Ruminococcus sp.]MDE7226053.1 hypothetical protein [Ruminococcus sp.]